MEPKKTYRIEPLTPSRHDRGGLFVVVDEVFGQVEAELGAGAGRGGGVVDDALVVGGGLVGQFSCEGQADPAQVVEVGVRLAPEGVVDVVFEGVVLLDGVVVFPQVVNAAA